MMADPLLHLVYAAGQSIAREVVLESALHITTVTAGQCQELYGSAPDILAEDQQPLDEQELLDALPPGLKRRMTLQDSSYRRQFATCLATPADPVDEQARARGFERLMRINAERTREAGLYEVYNVRDRLQWAEQQLQLLVEGQRARSAARRQRRRVLLRVLRISKQTVASIRALASV